MRPNWSTSIGRKHKEHPHRKGSTAVLCWTSSDQTFLERRTLLLPAMEADSLLERGYLMNVGGGKRQTRVFVCQIYGDPTK